MMNPLEVFLNIKVGVLNVKRCKNTYYYRIYKYYNKC